MRSFPVRVHLCASVALLFLAACAPQSTRMTVDDFDQMAIAMSQSLQASPAIAARGPHSEPWLVSVAKVENLTSDVMTESEQWKIMDDLIGSLPITTLWDEKQIRFVLPPEKVLMLRGSQDKRQDFEGFGADRDVTQVLNAVFRSTTRAESDGRTDLYYAEFSLLQFNTGQVIWTDKFEYKRSASGKIWD